MVSVGVDAHLYLAMRVDSADSTREYLLKVKYIALSRLIEHARASM